MKKRSITIELPLIPEVWKEASVLYRYMPYPHAYGPQRHHDLADLIRSTRTLVSLEEVFGRGLLERHEGSLGGLTPVPQKPRLLEPETVPCELCSEQTDKTGTKRCDRCYELETRIQDNPQLAELILERVNIERQIKAIETRERIKKRAYELDPECWISYSGKDRTFKRYMDKRRTEALKSATKEVNRQ